MCYCQILLQTTGQSDDYFVANERPPPINIPYVAPDVCSSPTTSATPSPTPTTSPGDGDGGAVQFACCTIVVVMIAMLSFLM